MSNEAKQAQEDAAWWRSKLPTGWQLHGFDYRHVATLQSPGGRLVQIDGELLLALRGQAPMVLPPIPGPGPKESLTPSEDWPSLPNTMDFVNRPPIRKVRPSSD